MSRSLLKLAREIYLATQGQVWRGGYGRDSWPEDLPVSSYIIGKRDFWTVSPEVMLGGQRLRVAVEKTAGDWDSHHRVLVFVDDKLVYPGGRYCRRPGPTTWWCWSTKVIAQEAMEGGKDSMVPGKGRRALLKEARKLRAGTGTHVVQLLSPEDHAAAEEAMREAEAELREALRRPQAQ